MAELRYREALNQALREEMTRDERVFIIGEDIGVTQMQVSRLLTRIMRELRAGLG